MINQTASEGLKGISRAVLTAVISLILAITVFATTAFAGLATQYNVEIVVDKNEPIVITTNEEQPIEILKQANITLEQSDKLDISAFTSGEGGTIRIDKENDINIEFDGVINTYSVYEDTVGEALDSLGITVTKNDRVNYSLSEAVKQGMVITIQSAKFVTLNADGKTTKFAIYRGSVKDLLDLAQIKLGKDDYTKPALNTQLSADMNVEVLRVEYKEAVENESIAYKTTTENDSSMDRGTQKVVVSGVNGVDEVTYKVKYVNGKQESKTELSRKSVKAPVTKKVKVGTKRVTPASNGVTSRNGYSVGQKINGRYTHYCACATCNGNSNGITSSGRRIRNGMADPHYVACNWLPLGSVISVDGTDYTVVDRGGSGLSAVGRIDIFTPQGHSACYRYGTGSCNIEIVRLGW